MVISGQIFSSGIVSVIQAYIDGEDSPTREGTARYACELLRWYDMCGNPKMASAKKAMLVLHKQGKLRLPQPTSNRQPLSNSNVQVDFNLPVVNADLRSHPHLSLDIVTSKKDRELWLHLIRSYHYLGESRIIGPQIKYLIRSGGVVLGAISFSSSAWSVKARDEWIGWNSAERQRGLRYILSNSRFLILPTVHIPNLASKVLSLAVKRISNDWCNTYGIKPLLLETFVDQRFEGTCYRSANWITLGMTTGRGRNDQLLGPSSSKRLFLYPLTKKLDTLKEKARKLPVLSNE